MTRSFFIGAVAALLAVPAAAAPETFAIDPAHTASQFAVKHMVVSTVRGAFGKTTGTVVFDQADASKDRVEATIDAATLTTRNEKRDSDVKGPDFLDVAKYPTITFKSTRVEPAGEGKLKVTGNLTIHGVTKPAVLDVQGPAAPLKDPWGKERIGASATTKINRKDFGINFSKTLDNGGAVLGDELDITIDLEAVKQGPAKT